MNSTDTVIRPAQIELEPTHFGKYIVQELIGKGAMGSVYRAYDPSIERYIAIKTISPDILFTDETGEFKARFLREVRAIGKINHSNIISIFDSGELNGNPFFAMEHVEGKELKEFLIDGSSITVADSHKFISQTLNALSYSHDCGIVHRDIKPSNIFIDNKNNVKIADFGIAKHINSDFTQHGSIIGTPRYMSPEQCQGKYVDHRSDLFSAAVVFYEMLTGEKCFTGSSSHTIMHKTISSTPEKPSKLNIHIPESLDHVILKALSKNPNDRYQTAKEFKDAIDLALSTKKSIKKNNHFTKYASFSLISIGLISLIYVLSKQDINWENITSYPFQKKSKTENPAITRTDLTRNNKISRLLKVANAHKLVGRYIAPQGSNAYSTYQLILSIDPNNHEARQGLQQINNTLLKQSQTLIREGKANSATNKVKIALSLYPSDSKLSNLLNSLENP